jgi:hypothetical protein
MTNSKSIMDDEKALIGTCTSGEYCSYHKKKKLNQMITLPSYSSPSTAPKIKITPDDYLKSFLKGLGSPYGPAGSWLLMGEQNDWYSGVLKNKFQGKYQIDMLNLGIAGVAHASGIIHIINHIIKSDQNVNLYFLDKCKKPLIDIKSAFPVGGNMNCDVIHSNATGGEQQIPYDIISAHFLFSFLNENSASGVIKTAYDNLKDDGSFVVATGLQSFMGNDISSYFEGFGLDIVDIIQCWDVYDLTGNQISQLLDGESVVVPNDNFLIEMKKGDLQ